MDGKWQVYQDTGIHGDPMDIDLFCPTINRQLARLLELSRIVLESLLVDSCLVLIWRASRLDKRLLGSSGVRRVPLMVRAEEAFYNQYG